MSARLRLGASLTGLVSGLVVAVPAHGSAPEPRPEPVTAVVTVTETTYTTEGAVVDTVAHAPIEVPVASARTPEVAEHAGTTGSVGPLADTMVTATSTHSGGTSSASGCKLLSVMKEGKTALGFTAYQFVNQTHWCWTRSTQTVYNVWTDWFLGKFDSNYYWRGIVKYVHGFYDYSTNDGHPRSAFKNLRIGHIDDCLLKYGCIAAIYPSVLIRSYYNGTYVWEIGG